MVAIFYLRWSSNEQRQCQAKCCLSSVLCSTWNYTLLVIASSRGPINALNSYRIATSKKNYSGYEQLSSFLDELFIIQIPNMSLSSDFNQLASSGIEPETLQPCSSTPTHSNKVDKIFTYLLIFDVLKLGSGFFRFSGFRLFPGKSVRGWNFFGTPPVIKKKKMLIFF